MLMNNTPWDNEKIKALFKRPFLALINKRYTLHKANFNTEEIELCRLLSIKTGACPEDCAYCPQSGHFNTHLEKEKLISLNEVERQSKIAKDNGASRFCMGAAWRNPPKKDFPKVLEMIKAVKNNRLETCATLGTLNQNQANQLKDAGLDYYNHNLDTSPRYYKKIISTRTYQDRLETLECVRKAGINICCGGIIGMGETLQDRIDFLLQLNYLPETPKSIPINRLIPIKGTPLEKNSQIDNFDFIKTIAVARIMFPFSVVRLSAGRETMSEEMQALCFMAGAYSIFYGDILLTAANASKNRDDILLKKLGLKIKNAKH